MDPSQRNAAVLHERVDKIIETLTQRFVNVLNLAQIEDTDYSTTAHMEAQIAEESAALVRATEDLSTLIRELQELWLFGGLDTLNKPADEEAATKQALEIARMVEQLAKTKNYNKGGERR
ncbi:hypothetical protein K469DRAFT_372459 [Zopfia rhizophila CBS 207.26]|uniref:Mediator of RNA polymerase II transcription subunit 22 n=1 Tax=Zopfia rhizophila CBS 207.26 TaxID=1314779 RepID=A0A6A6EJE2_9PEZI|nr:hypothetical protein K469DRAFT_372459 [Zopfia rhizophila CBS 207.26]